MTFPDVVIHTVVEARDAHPDYAEAKAGNPNAAVRLVADLLRPEQLREVGMIVGSVPAIIVPASAIEKHGFNAIPDAMALMIGQALGCPVDTVNINQINIVSHTRASGFHRLATPAVFDGAVESGSSYFLVDDHVGLGGTLANMKGYIESKGGTVLGCTCLTESQGSSRLALRRETLDTLWSRHGQELEEFWVEAVGHSLDCLTEAEAGYLCRTPSFVRIRNQMAKAAARYSGASA